MQDSMTRIELPMNLIVNVGPSYASLIPHTQTHFEQFLNNGTKDPLYMPVPN